MSSHWHTFYVPRDKIQVPRNKNPALVKSAKHGNILPRPHDKPMLPRKRPA